MEFDFHSTYANHSNVELLKIILQKELYQEAAVKAARDLLASRTVTEEEKTAAENDLRKSADKQQLNKEVRENILGDFAESLRKFVFPTQKSPAYFIRLFSIIYLVLWVISSIRTFGPFFVFQMELSVSTFIILLIHFGYLLVVYWLFRLNKNGWVLLFIYSSFTGGLAIYGLYSWMSRDFNFGFHVPVDIVQLVVLSFVFYFFNRRDVLETLKISKSYRIKVLLICSGIFLLAAFHDNINWAYYFT